MYRLKDELQVLKVAKDMLPVISGQIGENDSNNGAARPNPDAAEDEVGLIEQPASQIGNIAGVIEQSDIQRLRRVVFRTTKGKSIIYIRQYMDEEQEDVTRTRSVYMIVFWDGAHIRQKL